MNTTVKRKFNALLGSIGNRPTSSSADSVSEYGAFANLPPRDASRSTSALPTPSGISPSSSPSSHSATMGVNEFEFLAKKRRVVGPVASPSRPAGLSQSTTISNITLRKWTPTGSPAPQAGAGKTDSGPPKYCPGDREQLLRRLATFQELTDWTPKPDRVNEVEWAKRGWVSQGKERVRCVLCSQELAVKLNRKEVDGKEISVMIASEIAQSVVEKYAELIVAAHAEDCLWRKKGCDGKFSSRRNWRHD